MELERLLRDEFRRTVTSRDVAERKLRKIGAGIQRSFRRLLERSNSLFAPGLHARFVLGRQDFRAPQVFVGVNVLGFSGLLFARAFLARGFGYVLGASRPALCRAEKQAGAKNDAEAAAKRLP